MRAWRLPDGRRLLEETPGRFRLETPDGRVAGLYYSGSCSDQEHLYTTEYVVADGELRCSLTHDNWDSKDPATTTRQVELSGLTPET